MDNNVKRQLLDTLDNNVTPSLQKVVTTLEQLKRGIINPELLSIGSLDVIKFGITIYDSTRDDYIGLAVPPTECIIKDVIDISKINKTTYRLGLEVIYLGVLCRGEMYCIETSLIPALINLKPTIVNMDFYNYDLISAVSTKDSKYYYLKDLQQLMVVTPATEANHGQFLWYIGNCPLGSSEGWFEQCINNGVAVYMVEHLEYGTQAPPNN